MKMELSKIKDDNLEFFADTLREQVTQLRAWQFRILELKKIAGSITMKTCLVVMYNQMKMRAAEIENKLGEFGILNLFPGEQNDAGKDHKRKIR